MPRAPQTLPPDHFEQLAHAVAERRAILFVGAGVSMSVGLPSWRDLIGHMCAELGIEAEAGERWTAANYQTLAEYYRIRQGSIGPLRSWMDRHWSVSRTAVEGSEIHRLIVELDFPLIYTTNYDRNLEVAYEVHEKPFAKIATARDMSRAANAATQIVKFHGDFDDDGSLVLAESDYFERLAFDAPLDVKLRADAFARTVLFVGYSVSDMNVRLLLYKLWQAWRESGHMPDRPPSFVFMARPEPLQETVLGRWGITVLSEPGLDDPEEGLKQFLSRLAERVAGLRAETDRR
jgi:hypothetical protein